MEAGPKQAIHHGITAGKGAGGIGLHRDAQRGGLSRIIAAVLRQLLGELHDPAEVAVSGKDAGQGVPVAAVVAAAHRDHGGSFPGTGTINAQRRPEHQCTPGRKPGNRQSVALAHIRNGDTIKFLILCLHDGLSSRGID